MSFIQTFKQGLNGNAATSIPRQSSKPTSQFPLTTYFSLLSYLAPLLLLSLLILPRSSSYLSSETASLPVKRSSADRPEHPFLTPLTSNVLLTMGWDVVGIWICMLWWGSHLRNWWNAAPGSADGQTGDKEIKERQEKNGLLVIRLREASIATFGSALVFTPLLIALGAPLNEYILHTFLLALHLALLMVWPVVFTLGIPSIHDSGTYDRFRLTKLVCEFDAETPLERALVYPIVGTLIGAWIGALPIPLDWDRPWQSFPLTPAFTSILGFIAGGYQSWARSALDVLRADIKEDQASAAKQGTPKLKRKNKKKIA